jgi:hypothetical protein
MRPSNGEVGWKPDLGVVALAPGRGGPRNTDPGSPKCELWVVLEILRNPNLTGCNIAINSRDVADSRSATCGAAPMQKDDEMETGFVFAGRCRDKVALCGLFIITGISCYGYGKIG